MTGSKRSPNDRDKEIGASIRHFREAKEWTQADLGDAVGLTFQQIQKYEYGTNKISASRLEELCAALGISISEVLK